MLWEEKPCVSIMRLALSSMNLEAVVEQPLLEAPVQYGAQCVSDNMLLQVGVQGHCYSPTARDKSFPKANPVRANSCRVWKPGPGAAPMGRAPSARRAGPGRREVEKKKLKIVISASSCPGTTAQQHNSQVLCPTHVPARSPAPL